MIFGFRPTRVLALACACALAAVAGALIATSSASDRDAAVAGASGPSPASGERGGADSAPQAPRAGEAPKTRASTGPRDWRRLVDRIAWRDSVAIGDPASGRLEGGVRLPSSGPGFFTWDPIRKRSPNRDWRRWGTDELVRATISVLREFHRRHPAAPRVGIGDLSLPRGGYFGPEVSGGIGHASHQNGLDVDFYYPRRDRAERAPTTVPQVDLRLSQTLVDLWVAAGAEKVFVGPSLDLRGPPDVVQPLVNHDNHLHARLPASR